MIITKFRTPEEKAEYARIDSILDLQKDLRKLSTKALCELMYDNRMSQGRVKMIIECMDSETFARFYCATIDFTSVT